MALPTGNIAPRPPFLQRITPNQWISIDVGLSGLIFLGGLSSLIVDEHSTTPPHHIALLVIALCFATFPIAIRRKYPFPVLIVVTSALVMATLLGQGFAGAPVVALPLYIVATDYERRVSVIALGAVGVALLASLGIESLLKPTGANVTLNLNDVTSNIIVAGATWFVGDSVRARRAYLAGLTRQAEQRQLREVERAQQSIAEERLQIARELHDIVAHSLSVIAIQSGVGRHVLDLQPEEARKALTAVEATSRSALEELRRVLSVLRRDDLDAPSLAPAPGLADLDQLLGQCRAAGLEVTSHVHGQAVPMSPSMDLSIYRIVQEALTNVTKHAGTAQATVDISFEEGAVVVNVTDKGALHRNGAVLGSEPGDDVRAHHGIIGMRERTAMFGGSLTAAPRQGGGFEVLARLPLGSAPL
jgi:signal transduction histidine kinase